MGTRVPLCIEQPSPPHVCKSGMVIGDRDYNTCMSAGYVASFPVLSFSRVDGYWWRYGFSVSAFVMLLSGDGGLCPGMQLCALDFIVTSPIRTVPHVITAHTSTLLSKRIVLQHNRVYIGAAGTLHG